MKILSFLLLLFLPIFLGAQMVFTGAGVVLVQSNDYPVVSKVMLFSPAADVGIKSGETIWSVQGKSTQGMAIPEVTALIRGSAGAERTLVVGSDKREVKFVIRKVSGKCTKGDCMNGEGRIEEPNGNVYVGEFENGKFTWGSLVYANGDRYEGFFANGVAEGDGKYFNYIKGYRYQGNFKADKYQGSGNVEFFKGRAVYEGQFQANEPVGEGKLTFYNGVSKTLTPKNWDNLIEEATGVTVVIQKPTPQNTTKPAPKRTLGIDTDDGSSNDFTALINEMKQIEQQLANVIAAYPGFRQTYKEGLNKNYGKPEEASDYAKEAYKKFFFPYVEANKRLKNLGSTVKNDTKLSQRQSKAFDGWLNKIGEIFKMVEESKKSGKYTIPDTYWMNLNVEQARRLLDEAAVSRRAF